METEIRKQNGLFEDEPRKEIDEEVCNEVITTPYDPKSIDISHQTLTISSIMRRLKEDAIDLYPDFQRHADLWTVKQQSLLIESVLIRIPLPAFYFDAADNDRWQVIDGLQRLCAINNFAVRKDLKLTGLEYLKQFEDYTYDSLPAPFQRQIEETNIITYLLKSGTPEVKYNIFKRINTGGVVLNPQEIRNALNQGIPTTFIAELASLDSFKQATKLSEKRMTDKEFVTRFITFYLNKPTEYRPDLDTFMSNAMAELNKISQAERNTVKSNFDAAMALAFSIFGKKAFRKIYDRQETKQYPINKALFEVWSVLFSKLSEQERFKLLTKKEDLFDDFLGIMNENEDFVGAISSQTDNKNKIILRFSTIEGLIRKRLL